MDIGALDAKGKGKGQGQTQARHRDDVLILQHGLLELAGSTEGEREGESGSEEERRAQEWCEERSGCVDVGSLWVGPLSACAPVRASPGSSRLR